jgi:hypothetical protein
VSVPGRGRTAHEAAPVGSGACVGVGTLTLHSTEQRVRPQNEPEEPDATC